MPRHSRLRHRWQKYCREHLPLVFLVAAVILVVLLVAGITFLLSDVRFRVRW